MELSSGDETEDVGAVLPHKASDLVECVLELLEWWGEQEDGETELCDLGLDLFQELDGAVDIEVHVLLVEGVVDGVDGPLSECTELAGGDVCTLCEGTGGDRVAGVGEREEDGHVGDGSGDGSDVREVGVEDLLGKLEGLDLDLVNIDVTLVVSLSGESLGVPVGEVRDEHLLGKGTHQVLGCDHGDALLEPFVVSHYLLSDVLGIFHSHDIDVGDVLSL